MAQRARRRLLQSGRKAQDVARGEQEKERNYSGLLLLFLQRTGILSR